MGWDAYFPVVMEIIPRNSDPIRAPNDVALTVIGVRANRLRELGFELVMINPDSGRVDDCYSVVVEDLLNLEVPDNDICCVCDIDTLVGNQCPATGAYERLVVSYCQTSWKRKVALEINDARSVSLHQFL